MTYHVWIVKSTLYGYSIAERRFCDVCWKTKGIAEEYEKEPGGKQHRTYESDDNDTCDECRPLQI